MKDEIVKTGITEEKKAVHLLMYTNRLHKKVIDKHISEVGMYASQHRVLMYLAKFDKVPSQREVADHFEISTAAIAVTLKKLEKDGLISREKNEERYDNRYNEIKVTEKGRREVAKTAEFFNTVDMEMFENMTDGELEALCCLLEKIRDNLEKIADKT